MGVHHAHSSIQEIKGQPGESIARLTPLGWMSIGHINGLLQRSVQTKFIRLYNTKEIELQKISGSLTKFWEIEPVVDNVGRIMNRNDKERLDLILKSLKYENGKYQVQIP